MDPTREIGMSNHSLLFFLRCTNKKLTTFLEFIFFITWIPERCDVSPVLDILPFMNGFLLLLFAAPYYSRMMTGKQPLEIKPVIEKEILH